MIPTMLSCLLATSLAPHPAPPTEFEPNWESLETHPTPAWFEDGKFGIFIHWGVYALPAGVWEGRQIEKLGEQIQRHADISMVDYEAIARQFNPVDFDADAY